MRTIFPYFSLKAPILSKSELLSFKTYYSQTIQKDLALAVGHTTYYLNKFLHTMLISSLVGIQQASGLNFSFTGSWAVISFYLISILESRLLRGDIGQIPLWIKFFLWSNIATCSIGLSPFILEHPQNLMTALILFGAIFTVGVLYIHYVLNAILNIKYIFEQDLLDASSEILTELRSNPLLPVLPEIDRYLKKIQNQKRPPVIGEINAIKSYLTLKNELENSKGKT